MSDTRKYIDFTGLRYYDSKLKTWVTDLVNSHTPSVDAIQSIKAGQTELPVEEGTVTLSSVAGTGSYDDLKDKPELPDFTELMATISSLQSRVQELENQMIVNSEGTEGANDFSEVEPENSSDSVVTDYE